MDKNSDIEKIKKKWMAQATDLPPHPYSDKTFKEWLNKKHIESLKKLSHGTKN